MKRHQLAFGLLILTQAAHSIEEYFGRLWESFPPAYLVSGLVSQDRQLGFLVLNVALVTFGTWCYLVPVLRRWPSAKGIRLGWSLVELVNGVGHSLWSRRQGGYTPGVVTAPVLLVLSLVVFRSCASKATQCRLGEMAASRARRSSMKSMTRTLRATPSRGSLGCGRRHWRDTGRPMLVMVIAGRSHD